MKTLNYLYKSAFTKIVLERRLPRARLIIAYHAYNSEMQRKGPW